MDQYNFIINVSKNICRLISKRASLTAANWGPVNLELKSRSSGEELFCKCSDH